MEDTVSINAAKERKGRLALFLLFFEKTKKKLGFFCKLTRAM